LPLRFWRVSFCYRIKRPLREPSLDFLKPSLLSNLVVNDEIHPVKKLRRDFSNVIYRQLTRMNRVIANNSDHI